MNALKRTDMKLHSKVDTKQAPPELEKLHNQKVQAGTLLLLNGTIILYIYQSRLDKIAASQTLVGLDPISLSVVTMLIAAPMAIITSLTAAVVHETDSLSLGDRVEIGSTVLAVGLVLLIGAGVWPTNAGSTALSGGLNRVRLLVIIVYIQLSISTGRSLLREMVSPI